MKSKSADITCDQILVETDKVMALRQVVLIRRYESSPIKLV